MNNEFPPLANLTCKVASDFAGGEYDRVAYDFDATKIDGEAPLKVAGASDVTIGWLPDMIEDDDPAAQAPIGTMKGSRNVGLIVNPPTQAYASGAVVAGYLKAAAGGDLAQAAEGEQAIALTPVDASSGKIIKRVLYLSAPITVPGAGEGGNVIVLTLTDGADGTASITLQVQHNGADVDKVFNVEVWFSETANGAPTDLGEVTASTGQILGEATADARITVQTDATGAAVLSYDRTADGDLHVMAELDGQNFTGNVAVTGN